MFLRKTVVFTARSSDVPAAFKIPERFCNARSVCWATSPLTTCCVAGSSATCPETNTNPLALMACEYGPIALGPSLVAITSRMRPPGLRGDECNRFSHTRGQTPVPRNANGRRTSLRPFHFVCRKSLSRDLFTDRLRLGEQQQVIRAA